MTKLVKISLTIFQPHLHKPTVFQAEATSLLQTVFSFCSDMYFRQSTSFLSDYYAKKKKKEIQF